jgi:hypothetical protein
VSGVHVGQDMSEPIDAGVGLTQTIPSLDETRARAKGPQVSAGFPWVWVLSGAAVLAALGTAGMRRRGHWRTA